MQIILTRHGQTDLNSQKIISGQDDAKLTELGLAQARALGKALARFTPLRIYASDLDRAVKTALAVQQVNGGELTLVPELRERCYGEIQGKNGIEYDKALAASGLSEEEFRPPGGESRADLKNRIKPAVDRIINEAMALNPPGTLVIVAHHSVNRRLLSIWLGPEFGEAPQGNCCINQIEYDPSSGFKAVVINSVEHLK